jgi:hypothetical protein
MIVIALLASTAVVQAQSRTFYNSNGSFAGSSHPSTDLAILVVIGTLVILAFFAAIWPMDRY